MEGLPGTGGRGEAQKCVQLQGAGGSGVGSSVWQHLLGPCSLRVLGPLVCPHTSGQAPPWTVASVTVISVDRSLRGPWPLCTTASVGCPLRDCGLSGLWTVASVICGLWPL